MAGFNNGGGAVINGVPPLNTTTNVTIPVVATTAVTYLPSAFPQSIEFCGGVESDATHRWSGIVSVFVTVSGGVYSVDSLQSVTSEGTPAITAAVTVNASTGLVTITWSTAVSGSLTATTAGFGASPPVTGPTVLYATMAAFPDPDSLPVGTTVVMTDESAFVGMVAKRPHLEANGSQRNYYIQLQFAGFNWKYVTGSNTAANHLGRYNPADGLLYGITSTSEVPNCVIGSTTTTGGVSTAQRIGKPLASYLAAGQTLVPGQPLTWGASGRLEAWTNVSPTLPVGFLAIGAGFLPLSAGNTILGGFVSYLPFITPA